MKTIQLVYAQNKLTEKAGRFCQELEFAIRVKNLASCKQVAVFWAGNNNVWHVLPAVHHFKSGRDHEQWLARTSFQNISAADLPGNLHFALQYQVSGREYWDNNHNRNYDLPTEPGLLLGPQVLVTHIHFRPLLPLGITEQPVSVAVHNCLHVRRVFVRWTVDNWENFHETTCQPERHDRSHSKQDPHRHSDGQQQYSATLWSAKLETEGAFRIEYAIGCETDQGVFWDNNAGTNYIARHAGLKVLTLNLHCYQEAEQAAKFCEIARAIYEIDIDIVCLQEVGEEWNNGAGNWQSNAARIIQDHLRNQGYYYHLHTDWSHIGFDRYQEGCAILSKYRFLQQDAAYISTCQDIHNIHCRKVVMAQIHFPYAGLLNIFSVHLSWWKAGFPAQLDALLQWADNNKSGTLVPTLLCGDFNVRAGSQGYMLLADSRGYEDQFLRATSPALFTKIFRHTFPERHTLLTGDGRIDYIFASANSGLKPTSSRVLFSGQEYGRVSDHLGYLIEFEPEMASLGLKDRPVSTIKPQNVSE